MKQLFFLLAGTLLGLGATPAQAQWQTFTAANSGLRSDAVKEIAAADNGVIWVATASAVQRFDGSTWTTYTQAQGLDYTRINCVAVRGGVVWVGHDHGLSRFDGTAWTNFTTATDLPVGFYGPTDRSITDLLIGPDGTVWLAGSRGLGRYDGQTWRKYDRSNSGLQEEAITALALDETLNTLWIGTNCVSSRAGVYALNTVDNSWRYFNLAGRNCVHGLAVNRTGTVFVGTCNTSGLTTIDAVTGVQGSITASGCVTIDGMRPDPGNDGQVWVGVETWGTNPLPSGLLAYDGTRLTRQFGPGTAAPLPSPFVSTVAAQRVGGSLRLWVGTADKGLARYEEVVSSTRSAPESAVLQLSPNPASATVEVRHELPAARLRVFDAAGRLVHDAPAPAGTLRLDVHAWPAGLYHLRLTSAQGTITRRLLKA